VHFSREENPAIMLLEDGSTSPTLLAEVADWHNQLAWGRFQHRYDPLLRCWGRSYNLDDDTVDEICQLVWIELADRMKKFCYDPKGRFRGLLRHVFHWRVVDFVRRRRASSLLSLDDAGEPFATREEPMATDEAGACDADGQADVFRFFIIEEAEKAQAAVKAKVRPQTWDAFWLVAVQDWTVERTGEVLGMTHTAVYAARSRVARMLGDEGKRVLCDWPRGH
jgi:RNA polymerase sigma factor (sigma-70 family)